METKNTNVIENNVVTLSGEITSKGEFSHEVYKEGFYSYTLSVKRLSEEVDNVVLTISERLINPEALAVGTKVTVTGQFRSYNLRTESKNRLILSVFVREISEDKEEKLDKNSIEIRGYICKKPNYRKTPLGREICDLLIAVNRPYGKSDYIPCICWGRNARYTSDFEVGQEISINGRIQSRTYTKKLSDTELEERTAYEVSISKIEAITNEK